MSEQDKQEAAEHAARAARQAKHAPRMRVGLQQKGQSTLPKRESAGSSGSIPRALAAISSDMGIGFIALSVSLYAGVIAFDRFNSAYHGRLYPVSR